MRHPAGSIDPGCHPLDGERLGSNARTGCSTFVGCAATPGVDFACSSARRGPLENLSTSIHRFASLPVMSLSDFAWSDSASVTPSPCRSSGAGAIRTKKWMRNQPFTASVGGWAFDLKRSSGSEAKSSGQPCRVRAKVNVGQSGRDDRRRVKAYGRTPEANPLPCFVRSGRAGSPGR